MKEIERKWILQNLPDLQGQQPIHYERHFLYIGENNEIRIQKKAQRYEFERKVQKNSLARDGQKFEITKEEFDQLKTYAIASIEREGFLYEGVSIKIYKGNFTGLIRAEVEFPSENDALAFIIPTWFGKEITDTPLGKDKLLSRLSTNEFQTLLLSYKP